MVALEMAPSLVDRSDPLWGDGEVLLGLGQGVRQGADNVGEAGKEPAIKFTMPSNLWTSSMEEGRGNWLMALTFSGRGRIPSESTV